MFDAKCCLTIFLHLIKWMCQVKEVYIMNTDKIIAENIASEYAPKKTSKLVALKKLDRKVKQGPEIFGYSLGVISSLILGTGMCFSMGVLGNNSLPMILMGVGIGILGIVGVSVNYPIYKKILKSRKMKYGNDIIQLANDIANE